VQELQSSNKLTPTMLRRSAAKLGSTNRYTDGSGRKLDTNVLPVDMFVPPISNRAYPRTTEHWQLTVADEPSPYKGKVVVSGGGVIGLTAASLFATRGWHVTVVEQRSDPHELQSMHSTAYPHRIQSALLTRRAADALGHAGVTVNELRTVGVRVAGVHDHPGAFNSFFTRGLTEHHRFAVNMLAVDLPQLRLLLDEQIRALPSQNCKIFYDHKVMAVLPQLKKLVVKPLRDFEKDGAPSIPIEENHDETSLSVNLKQFDEVNAEGLSYDLIVCAEGANSSLRNFLDVEGFAADREFVVKWFELKSKSLSRDHIHRWLHSRNTRVRNLAALNTDHQTPMCIAFPRLEEGSFALMMYLPQGELERLSPEELVKAYCADVAAQGFAVASGSAAATPYPTVHCDELFNSVGLPSAVMVGDAAHTCNPFLMQGLALGLEDCTHLINNVDATSRHFYDAVRQYSRERGGAGDSLRVVSERCLYYEKKKHVNPLLRWRNAYQRFMNVATPKSYNNFWGPTQNHMYSRSIETMLNGRGYTSYEYVERQQTKHMQFFQIGRLFN
jgi:2-polyprenyl-6-methoxyphenol hydroxylase-like FAD-dependent oxidoreductase